MKAQRFLAMNLYRLQTPERILAATSGVERIYYDCGECGAKSPVIVGYLGTGPSLREAAVLTKPSEIPDAVSYHLAVLCETCFQKHEQATS